VLNQVHGSVCGSDGEEESRNGGQGGEFRKHFHKKDCSTNGGGIRADSSAIRVQCRFRDFGRKGQSSSSGTSLQSSHWVRISSSKVEWGSMLHLIWKVEMEGGTLESQKSQTRM